MSSPYFWPTVTPRFEPRAELGYPCAPLALDQACWPKWLGLPAQNWLCFLAQSHSSHGSFMSHGYHGFKGRDNHFWSRHYWNSRYGCLLIAVRKRAIFAV